MKPYELLPVTSVMRGAGKSIDYFPNFGKFLTSATSAIFLSHFMYWEGKQQDEEGWIYKKMSDIQKETGLSRWEIQSARKTLCALGILQEKKCGLPSKIHYLFDWPTFDKLFSEYMANQGEPVKAKKQTKKQGPAADEPKKENMLGLLKDVFDKYFVLEYPIGYEWSRDEDGSKDWKGMKELKLKLHNRLVGKLKRDPTTEELIHSFDMILKNLPEYHKKVNFTPLLLNSAFNKILIDISNGFKQQESGANNKNEQYNKQSASDFV